MSLSGLQTGRSPLYMDNAVHRHFAPTGCTKCNHAMFDSKMMTSQRGHLFTDNVTRRHVVPSRHLIEHPYDTVTGRCEGGRGEIWPNSNKHPVICFDLTAATWRAGSCSPQAHDADDAGSCDDKRYASRLYATSHSPLYDVMGVTVTPGMGQCCAPTFQARLKFTRHVLPLSRYGPGSGTESPSEFNHLFIGPLPTFPENSRT